ncbi:MAG: UDP-N-acetylglucosamine 1-carboxyvinyltransferase [Chloroflexi bacterium]|nr:UDP-N-acetylglucosamine 1-carboxyvinyltransferase [Chloroflexota bacterium]
MTVTGPRPAARSGTRGQQRLVIEGGHPLRGSVEIVGAKNAALPIMAACLLSSEWCVLSSVPDIEDIHTMANVLRSLGAEVNVLSRHSVAIRAEKLSSCRADPDLAQRMRASFLVMGPLLARLGRAEAPHPGGCAIGERPVNVDVRGFEAMGARVRQEGGFYLAAADCLRGRRIYLDYPSHTGTENLLMAACLADGTTIVKHASLEPEVADLARFLTAMGARIEGIGTSFLKITGVERLHGTNYRIIPDRLAAGTFLIAGVISKGDVTVRQVIPEHLDAVSHKLQEVGAHVEEGENWVRARYDQPLEAVEIQAIAYPGFPTDLQAAFAALLTQARGTSPIHERVFENRLGYTRELRRMGTELEAGARTARIFGPRPLHGAHVKALDIRCGAALVVAALAADGTTTIENVYHLDRGYEDLEETLVRLGAVVSRE